MKKVLFTMFMLTACIAVYSQGEWKKSEIKADPLKGIDGGDVYIYTDPEMGSFIFWGYDTYQFQLVSKKELFHTKVSDGDVGYAVSIGIYDTKDKMVEMFKLWLDLKDNSGHQVLQARSTKGMSAIVGQKSKVKKMFKTLQSDGGYIRIVTPRHNTTDFDLKITPYKE